MFPETDSFAVFTENEKVDHMLRTWKSCASIRAKTDDAKMKFKEEDSLPAYMLKEIEEIEGTSDPYFDFHSVDDSITCLMFEGKRDLIPYTD